MRPAGREHWKIISITAHREVSPKDITIIRSAMKVLVEKQSVDAIYFGGAIGGDTVALRAAAAHRKGNRPHLVVVVPDTEAAQPFPASQWYHLADEVIELGNKITQDDGYAAYDIRNQYLVNIGTSVVAFYSGKKASGTGKTVGFAESLGVLVHEVPIGR